MQHFIDSILVSSASGMRPMGNASVTVYIGGTTAPAAIFSDDGVTPMENPFFSSPEGAISFYAANGRYDLRISHPSYPVSWVRDVLFQDYIGDPLVRVSDLAPVAFTGNYSDLVGRPVLGSAAAANVNDFATAVQGAKADTAVQPGSLAAVATTGDYGDLLNKPSIPADQVPSDWAASSGVARILNKPALGTAAAMNATAFATATQGSKADTAVQPGQLGALATKDAVSVPDIDAAGAPSATTYLRGDGTWATPAGGGGGGIPDAPVDGDAYARKDASWAALSSVAVSGSYADLSNKPIIPAAQVPSDWSASTGVSRILNKPALGTAAAANTGDFATAAQGSKADTALQPAAIGVTVQGYSAVLAGTTASFTTAEKSKLSGIAPNATANTGTVTSVQATVPAGLQVSGGPITGSGTLSITYASGYSIPTNAKQGQWDTAYGWGNHASAGYALSSSLAAVATSGSYNDLSNKPSIPTSPGGDFVGTTSQQTLTDKTLGAGTKESVAVGSTITINDAAAPFQQITLASNATATINLSVGVSRTIWINPVTYTITWPVGTVLVGDIEELPASKWSLITLTGMPSNTDGVAALVASQP